MWLLLALLSMLPSPPQASRDLATFLPVTVPVSQGGDTTNLQLLLPTRGSSSIGSPQVLLEYVTGAWDAVVEHHQAGLAEPKQESALSSVGLSSEEAWHHFQAAQAGVVDSARFLITFSLVPSVQTGGSPLHIAAALGNVERVRQLLEDGARVDEAKEDGTTALHSAATMGHAEVVQLLLEEEAWAEATGASGATALMMAASMGHSTVVVALLEGGAGADTPHSYGGSTALHLAAEVGREEVVRELCKRGATVETRKVTGGTAIHSAADANQTAVVRILVAECGADINALLARDTTPLYLAAQRGFTEVVAELLRLGAALDFVMPRGETSTAVISEGQGEGFYPVKNTEVGNGATVLHAAVENGHLETTRTLLTAGATQSASMEGATPLVIALQYRHPAIALLLLQDGWTDPHMDAQVPSDGSSALLVAVMYNYLDVVKRLLERGADPDIATPRGMTPLLQAASRGQEEIVSLLLEARASPPSLHSAVGSGSERLVRRLVKERRTMLEEREGGLTALHLAVKGGRPGLVALLLEAGGEVGATVEGTGATALHLAALNGRLEVVRLLLARGGEVGSRAGDSLHRATPIYLAAQNGHAKVVQELVASGAEVNARLWKIDATPLFAAADQGHLTTVEMLLKLGTSVYARNWNGVTALGVAAVAGRVEVVARLLEAGAKVDSRDQEGNSVLLQVVGGERVKVRVVEQLLRAGASPGLVNLRGEFPLLVVARREQVQDTVHLLRLLLQAGAQVKQEQEEEGDGQVHTSTALGAAVVSGGAEAVKELLEAGASYSSPVLAGGLSQGGLLPLGVAVKRRRPGLVKLLLEKGARRCEQEQEEQEELEDCMRLAVSSRDPELIRLISEARGSYAGRREEL